MLGRCPVECAAARRRCRCRRRPLFLSGALFGASRELEDEGAAVPCLRRRRRCCSPCRSCGHHSFSVPESRRPPAAKPPIFKSPFEDRPCLDCRARFCFAFVFMGGAARCLFCGATNTPLPSASPKKWACNCTSGPTPQDAENFAWLPVGLISPKYDVARAVARSC